MTQNHWFNLYLTSAESPPSSSEVAALLRAALEASGYTTYDPFGGVLGRAYPQTVRLFVAPVRANWVRVLANDPIPNGILQTVSRRSVCLWLYTNGDALQTDVYTNGQRADDPAFALAPFLREGKLPTDLRSALNQPDITIIDADPPDTYLPTDALPEDMQRMAQDIDPKAMNRMFDRIAGNIFGRTSGDRDAASDMLNSARPFNWNSPAGWKVRAMMDMLTVPDTWREPDFVTLRDAYSLHARRQRKPDARLYPGDQRTLDAVPDALKYTPIYAGKDG